MEREAFVTNLQLLRDALAMWEPCPETGPWAEGYGHTFDDFHCLTCNGTGTVPTALGKALVRALSKPMLQGGDGKRAFLRPVLRPVPDASDTNNPSKNKAERQAYVEKFFWVWSALEARSVVWKHANDATNLLAAIRDASPQATLDAVAAAVMGVA